jgi:hypothetical protein
LVVVVLLLPQAARLTTMNTASRAVKSLFAFFIPFFLLKFDLLAPAKLQNSYPNKIVRISFRLPH